MTDTPPAPGNSRFSPRAMAHLALGALAREVSDFARAMVPAGLDRHGYDGLLVADAVRLGELAAQVLAAAVVAERADDTGWDSIGASLGVDAGTAQARWDSVVQTWNADLAQATGPGQHDDDELPEVLTEPPALLARELDLWAARHREPTDPPAGPHQVSEALQGMDPLRELMHLSGALQQLHQITSTPDPGELARLRLRVAALEVILGVDPPTE